MTFPTTPPSSSLPRPDGDKPLDARERAVHILSRLAFCPLPEEVDWVQKEGVEAWLDRQLSPDSVPNRELDAVLAGFPSVSMSRAEIRESFGGRRPKDANEEQIRQFNRMRRTPKREMLQAVFFRAVGSGRQLFEVLCDFWRNHLNVSYTKGGLCDLAITSYEQDVVQAHALNTFPSMLFASAKHPAMLFYLDNVLSRRPASKQELKEIERRTRRRTGSRERAAEEVALAEQRGLNENYARELLELHTLGVDNGYKQKDVVELARALTGWTIDAGREGSGDFRFRPDMHDPGPKRVLGRAYENDTDGVKEGEEILKALSAHKRTAEFIAMKLVRYLVADNPPEELVEAAAKTYRKTGGDIKAMLRSIVLHDAFFHRRHYRTKFKTPHEFVVSAIRSTGAVIEDVSKVLGWLEEMGQPLYHCDDPTGWYDTTESWLDPGVMALRWQFGLDLAQGRIRGVSIPEDFYAGIASSHPRLWQHDFTRRILPGGAGRKTRAVLSQTTDQILNSDKKVDRRKLGTTLVGLLLGSPEFQQQ